MKLAILDTVGQRVGYLSADATNQWQTRDEPRKKGKAINDPILKQ